MNLVTIQYGDRKDPDITSIPKTIADRFGVCNGQFINDTALLGNIMLETTSHLLLVTKATIKNGQN